MVFFLLCQGIPAGHSPCNRSTLEDCHPPPDPVKIRRKGVATEGGSSHDVLSVPWVVFEVKLMENNNNLFVLQVNDGHGDCKSYLT